MTRGGFVDEPIGPTTARNTGIGAGQQWVNRTHQTVLEVLAADPSAPGRWWVRLQSSGMSVSFNDEEIRDHYTLHCEIT